MIRCFAAASSNAGVEIDDFLVFVIEKIDLRPDHAEVVQPLEELLARLGRPQFARMPPEPEPDAALARIVDQFLDLLVAPA